MKIRTVYAVLVISYILIKFILLNGYEYQVQVEPLIYTKEITKRKVELYRTEYGNSRNSISVSGSISEDEVWSADTVNVIGDIAIENGVTLTIDQGTYIDFAGFFGIDVYGRILAQGSINDTIVFTRSDTSGFYDLNSLEGAWAGINFPETSIENDSSMITFCKIEYGKAFGQNAQSSQGGGIFIAGFSKVKIENSRIRSCMAVNGGGIVTQFCSIKILSSIIEDCLALNSAGGVGCFFRASPIIKDCKIKANHAFWGGGIECYDHSSPLLSNLKVSENSGVEHCGGILCSHNSSPDIINCEVFENTAFYGTGIDCFIDSGPRIINTLIYHNYGFSDGGALSVSYNSNPELINVTVVENYSDEGCGGIHIADSQPILRNSIIWNNDNFQIYLLAYQDYNNEVTVSHSIIEGGIAGIGNGDINEVYWLEGNLDSDPLLIYESEQLFSLNENSPGIDAGDIDTTGYYLPPWDFLGNNRIWDGDEDGNVCVDMGAYEFGAPLYTDAENDIIMDTPSQISNLKNYPNPFNPVTTISFEVSDLHLDDASSSKYSAAGSLEGLKLEIYNIRGQKIKAIIIPPSQFPSFSFTWNGTDAVDQSAPSGIYFSVIKQNDQILDSLKMLLLK
ncbi:hypothetical protein ACFLYK_00240 [Candidatus Cloacimonadota bacterium]